MSQLSISRHRKLLHTWWVCYGTSRKCDTTEREHEENHVGYTWDIKEAHCEQRARGSPGNGCL